MTSLSTLINDAIATRDVVVARTWTAQRHFTRPHIITVWHYTSPMFQYNTVSGVVVPIDRGRHGRSDKEGVRTILSGIGLDLSYDDIWESASHRVTRKGNNG